MDSAEILLEATPIDLDDWVLSGGGNNGLSYNHIENDSLVLKMNKATFPKAHTVLEFQRSQAMYEMGINCPKVIDFVTDGERFGLIAEKINGKKSFARIISEDPGQLGTLAKVFASNAKQLHQVRCDNGLIPNYRENYFNSLCQNRILSAKEKQILTDALDAMDDKPFCIHGDLTPGNIIRAEEKDYWIDLGDVSYGDPDIDFGNMMFISEHIPEKLVYQLYHISREQFREFARIFAQEYYGDRWGTPELNEKLHNVLLIRAGAAILRRPQSSFFYRPLLNGKICRYRFRSHILNLIVSRMQHKNR